MRFLLANTAGIVLDGVAIFIGLVSRLL